MRTLHVRLLGDFHLIYGDEPVVGIDTPRPQSVLTYVLLHRQAPQPRHRVAFALWPTSTESQAHTNLRKQLYHLRHALPDAERFLHIDDHTVRWRPEAPFTLDVADFEREIAAAQQAEETDDVSAMQAALERAVALYHGDLLPGCYDDWILPVRERLARMHVRALDRLTQLLEAQRDYVTAIRYVQRLLRYDALYEMAYRRLMRLYALNGQRAKALETYQRCAEILAGELDVEPSLATQAVYERLLSAKPPAPIEVQRPTSLPLVGRQRAWTRLQSAWQAAADEGPHLALVTGEAGIGKTRLAEELVTWVERQGMAAATTRVFAVEGPLAYAPVISWLRTDALQRALSQLDAVWLTELARLLPELLTEHPALSKPEPLTENWQRQRLFEALARAVLKVPQPLLLFIDDLQWSDAQTLAWLHYLLRFDPEARLLVLSTLRTEDVPAGHPLTSLLAALRGSGTLTEILLDRLNANETAVLAQHVTGHELGAAEASDLHRETEGNPLFVVEMLRSRRPDARDVAPAVLSEHVRSSLPPKVHAVIKRRLKQLSSEARALTDLAAVIGREFTFSVVIRASDQDETAVVEALEELGQRRIIYEREGGVYDFSHNKLREVAYDALSRARRRYLHARVAEALEAVCAKPLPEVDCDLARHYTAADEIEKAVTYRLTSGKQALELSAHQEAIHHLRQGLALLETLPETPHRHQTELAFQMALGSALIPQQGFTAPEVRKAYDRAAELARRLGAEPQLVPALYGLGQYTMLQGNWRQTRSLGERALRLAQETRAPADLILAHGLLGFALSYLGEPAEALEHLRGSLSNAATSAVPSTGTDIRVMSRCYAGMMLWILGCPDQSLSEMEGALELAHDLDQPHTQAAALSHAGGLYLLRQEAQRTQIYQERAIALSMEYGFPYWQGLSQLIRGWALAQQQHPSEGLTEARQGLEALTALGVSLDPYTYTLLAEVYVCAGDVAEGMRAVETALTGIGASGLRAFESMTHRVKGELLALDGAASDAIERCYRQAIAVAQAQGARSFELQATARLARLWQREGRQAEAHRILSQIYDQFTEGFDAPDLEAASALLDALA